MQTFLSVIGLDVVKQADSQHLLVGVTLPVNPSGFQDFEKGLGHKIIESLPLQLIL
jgi:hypothetical protein